MLAAGKRDVALESYAAAEKLLGSDPARRVEVVARRGQALEGMGKDDEAVAEYRRAIKLAPEGLLPRGRAHRPHHRHLPPQAGAAAAARAVREGVARGRARSLRVGHARQALRGDRRAGQGDRRAQEGRREGAVGARDAAPADPAARELGPRRRGARAVRGGRARRAGRGAVPARARRALLAPRRGEEGARRARRGSQSAIPERRRRARRRSPTSTRAGARRTSRSPSTSGSRSSSPTIRRTSSRSASSTTRRATRQARAIDDRGSGSRQRQGGRRSRSSAR